MCSFQLTFLLFVLYRLVNCGFSQTYPSSVFVPSNAINDVSLSCSGMRNQLKWRFNGSALNLLSAPSGINVNIVNNEEMQATQTLTIQKASVWTYNGTSFQCSHGEGNFTSVPTAFIIVYGKHFIFPVS